MNLCFLIEYCQVIKRATLLPVCRELKIVWITAAWHQACFWALRCACVGTGLCFLVGLRWYESRRAGNSGFRYPRCWFWHHSALGLLLRPQNLYVSALFVYFLVAVSDIFPSRFGLATLGQWKHKYCALVMHNIYVERILYSGIVLRARAWRLCGTWTGLFRSHASLSHAGALPLLITINLQNWKLYHLAWLIECRPCFGRKGVNWAVSWIREHHSC